MPRSPYALRSRAKTALKEIVELSDSSQTDEIEQQMDETEEIEHHTSETIEDQVHALSVQETSGPVGVTGAYAGSSPDEDAFSADLAEAIAQSLREHPTNCELLASREIRRQQELEYEEALAIDRAREAEIEANARARAQRLLDAQSECAKYVRDDGSFHLRIYDLHGFSHSVRTLEGATVSTLYAFCLAKLGIDMRERKLSCAWPKEVLHDEPRVLSTFLAQSSVLRIVADL